MDAPSDVLNEALAAKANGEAFAIATVVRTVAMTAAKAGAKALIRADGSISAGWIGGGCARAAVLKAARESLADGAPRLISVQPPDSLRERGREAGETKEGILYARNMCPSEGTMDIFIEPVLPKPELLICGSSPVATALADLGARMGYRIAVAAASEEHGRFGSVDAFHAGFAFAGLPPAERYVVVATQGRGDEAALSGALSIGARHVAFVGSHRKAAALKEALARKGVDGERLAQMRSPAGLDIGAVTPDEIALSILAEIIAARRRGHRRHNEKLKESAHVE